MEHGGLNTRSHLPISVLYILISLTSGELNREGIIKRVEECSKGSCPLTSFTLPTRLEFMINQKWIEADPIRRSISDHPGTIYYRLLPSGRSALADEIDRLEAAIALGRQHLSLPAQQSPTPVILKVNSSVPSDYWDKRAKRDQERVSRSLNKKNMSVDEAAKALNVSDSTIYVMLTDRRLQASSLHAQRDGQQRRITTVSVRRIMRQQAGTGSIPKKKAGRHQNLAPPSMTVREAANYLGASKSSIRRWRSSGILEDASPDAGKVNGERVTTASVQKLVKSEKAAGWRKRSTIERK